MILIHKETAEIVLYVVRGIEFTQETSLVGVNYIYVHSSEYLKLEIDTAFKIGGHFVDDYFANHFEILGVL